MRFWHGRTFLDTDGSIAFEEYQDAIDAGQAYLKSHDDAGLPRPLLKIRIVQESDVVDRLAFPDIPF